jgi:hypothetical protein
MDMQRLVLLVFVLAAWVIGACVGEPAGADSVATPPAPSQSAVSPEQRGLGFVRARGCAECHQSSNSRDGVLSGQTTPLRGTHAYPANLTPDPDTGLGGWTNAEIVRAIRDGVDDQNEPLCASMPHFSDMKDEEATAIVEYLRSLGPVHREIPSSDCAKRKH